MTILALETSTPAGSLVLWRDDRVVFGAEFITERAHNAALFGPLAKALDQVRDDEEVFLVIGRGPGSYTGVRIAIAAAQGLSLARAWPVLGLGLGASLAGIGAGSGWIAGDARRAQYFVQECVAGQLGAAQVMEAEDFERLAPAGELLRSAETRWAEGGPAGVIIEQPQAAVLAASAATLGLEELRRRSTESLEPGYVRAPFITQPKSSAKQIK